MDIVYNSFEGRCDDSPRVLCGALRRQGIGDRHVWLADPAQDATFPDGCEVVEYGSAACVEALEAADLLVANTHTDVAWRKRPDAFYLQTWHGTPLKRIHWDVLWAPEGRLERLQRDVDRWDCLLAPNAASVPLLRRAFRYEGEVLESGYPRNDVLQAPDADAVRDRVRRDLGIPAGATAVLYTPTWRDDAVFAEGGRAFDLALDVERAIERLGPGHVLLLRLHYFVRDRLTGLDRPGVLDVSTHPDVSELYLAADAMVTDYSSTMFDFAITGKPLLLYVYDLDDYAQRLRGFYFDLEPIAPGPLLRAEDELLDALADLPAIAARYAERYAAFRERFAHAEDGHATERVVQRIVAAMQATEGV